MSKQEILPGQFSQAEIKASFKPIYVMSVIAIVVLVFFGFLGRNALVAFQVNDKMPGAGQISVPDWVVNSSALGTAFGFVLVAIALTGAFLVRSKRAVPMWLNLVFGLFAIVTLLGWLAAGNNVPVAFLLNQALGLSVPIILGGMAGVMSERVGVVNIAIEGQLLTGAFVAAVVGTTTGNLWIGLVAAMIASALLSMSLASLSIKYLVDQIIIGVLLNVLVVGVTNFLYYSWLTQDSQHLNFPGTFPIVAIPGLSQLPIIGPALFDNRVTVYLTLIIVPVLWFVLFRTRLGLRARAVGEHPLAADTVGINVARTRFWWVTFGGMVAGIGGAALSIGNVGAFGREMSAGEGFIALAVVILGRWQPYYIAMAALLFGFAIELRVWANQVSPGTPTDFIMMVPYLVTLIAVAGFAGKARGPAASGKPYIKG